MATEKPSDSKMVEEMPNEQEQQIQQPTEKPTNIPTPEIKKRPSRRSQQKVVNHTMDFKALEGEDNDRYRKKGQRSRTIVRSRFKSQIKRAKSRACFKLPVTVKRRGRPKKCFCGCFDR